MNHSHGNDETYEWVCERTTVPPVIGGRKNTTATGQDPGAAAPRRGMRARPVRITYDYSRKR